MLNNLHFNLSIREGGGGGGISKYIAKGGYKYQEYYQFQLHSDHTSFLVWIGGDPLLDSLRFLLD